MEWTDPKVYGCASATAKANVWRFASELDYGDLMQEFALVFIRLQRSGKAEDELHFIHMFRRKVRWTLFNLIRRHVGRYRCDCKVLASVIEADKLFLSDDTNLGYTEILGCGKEDTTVRQREVARLVSEAPEPVRKYVTACVKGEIRKRGHRGGRETARDAIRRLTGCRPVTVQAQTKVWAEAKLGFASVR